MYRVYRFVFVLSHCLLSLLTNMILVIIAFLTLPLQNTTCYKPPMLLGRPEREDWMRTYTAVQRTDLRKACSYHFSNSRGLSIVILDSMSEDFRLFVMHILSEFETRHTLYIDNGTS